MTHPLRQYGLKQLLLLTAGIAALLGLARWCGWEASGSAIVGAPFGALAGLTCVVALRGPRERPAHHLAVIAGAIAGWVILATAGRLGLRPSPAVEGAIVMGLIVASIAVHFWRTVRGKKRGGVAMTGPCGRGGLVWEEVGNRAGTARLGRGETPPRIEGTTFERRRLFTGAARLRCAKRTPAPSSPALLPRGEKGDVRRRGRWGNHSADALTLPSPNGREESVSRRARGGGRRRGAA